MRHVTTTETTHEDDTSTAWRAVRVRPQHQLSVARLLASGQFPLYVPTYRIQSARRDRLKHLDLPLFPGYVFAQFSLDQKGQILRTPMVLDILRFGSRVAVITDEEIAALRAMEAAGAIPAAYRPYKPGDAVEVRVGTARVPGVVLEANGEATLLVTIEMLRATVAVKVEVQNVRRAA